ncbi:MAG: hypothetical protein R3C45_18940 [Phycisphaerales bacterium]
MGELLLQPDTEKPSDPATAKQVEIAGLRIDYQRLLAEAGRAASHDPQTPETLRKQGEQAFDKLTDATRAPDPRFLRQRPATYLADRPRPEPDHRSAVRAE